MPAFPGEGVGRTVVVGQRVSYTVIGNGLAVIGGQTVLPAIGGVAVSVSLLSRAEGSQSEGIGLLFQNIAPAVVGIGIALIGVFVILTKAIRLQINAMKFILRLDDSRPIQQFTLPPSVQSPLQCKNSHLSAL